MASGNISKAVQLAIQFADDNTHGYDQQNRNGPDYDCSSFIATMLNKAGFNVSPYSWTGNIRTQLINCGFHECTAPFQAGDIHLTEGKHMCMSIDGKQIVQASINEKGTTTGGKTGDQTGKEIWIRSYYDYPWQYHYRYRGVDSEASQRESLSGKTVEQVAKEVIAGRWGNGEQRKKQLESYGCNYKEVQEYVNYLLSPHSDADYAKIAREVIQGKWGNGKEREERLEKAGYPYKTIQKMVNDMLK